MEQNKVNKDICNVISSGSHGNAVLYHEKILVDIGVNYKKIEPFKKTIQLVALTHGHCSDHLHIKTLKRLQFERPSLRICCGEFMLQYLDGLRNIDIIELGNVYDYRDFSISAVKLYHDLPCYGYRIFKENHKTIHITDTSHVIGISALNYDLIAIEHNYNDETIYDSIARIEAKGGYAYQKGAINSHLSEQQARDFIFKNASPNSQIIRLHESSNY